MTHAELVDEIEARCRRRRLRCQRTPDLMAKCPRCGAAIAARRGGPAGWIDLVILGRGGGYFVEVKSEDGRRTLDQMACARDVARAGLRYRVWRPSDLAASRIDQQLDLIA